MAAFSKEDLALLAQTITTALQRSGGSRYNPISNETHKSEDSPAARADAIRAYKNSQDHNKILKDLEEIQRETNKTMESLDRAVEYNSKTLTKAINEYEDIATGQKELVKAWRNQINKGDDSTSRSIKALIGNIDNLEDVLRASDSAKVTADLLKAMKSLEAGNNSIDDYLHQINHLNAQLSRNGKTLKDVDPNLAAIHEDIKQLAIQAGAHYDNKNQTIDASELTDDMKKFMSGIASHNMKSKAGQEAMQNTHKISLQTATDAINAHAGATTKLTGLYHTSRTKLMGWAAGVTSATFAINELAKVAAYAYQSLLTAANTGTQRSVMEVFGNNVKAISNGIDPKVLQEIQAKNAGTRATYGKDKFDDSVVASKAFLSVTGDRGEASKIKAEMLSMMQGIGIESKDAATATGSLAKSMGKLQYLTGMTGEQLAQMTSDMANDKDFKQSMIGLNSQERKQAIENIQLMMQENRVRGLTIDQSKELFKAQQDLRFGGSRKKQLHAAAQMEMVGHVMGVKTDILAGAERVGGIDQYIKSKGYTGDQAKAVREQYNQQQIDFSTKANELKNSQNNGVALMMDGLEEHTQPLNPLYNTPIDAQTVKANAIIGDAAKEYKEGAEISLGAAKMMMAANAISTLSNGPLGGFAAGALGSIITLLPWGKIFGKVAGGVGSVASGSAGKLVTSYGGMAWNTAREVAGNAIGGKFDGIKNAFKSSANIAETAGSVVSKPSIIERISTFTKSTVPGATNTAKSYGGAAWNTIKDVGGMGINAAKEAGGPKIASVIEKGSGALGWIAKKAPIITTALAALDVGSVLMDNTKTKAEKVEGVGASIGTSVGAAGGAYGGTIAGAATGAMIGSIVPIIGTAIGGVVGGAIGGLGGGYIGGELGGWGGSKIGKSINAVTQYSTPNQPAVTRDSIKQDAALKAGIVDLQNPSTPNGSQRDFNNMSPKSGDIAAPDPISSLNKSIDGMVVVLTNIYTLLQTQSEEINGSSEKQLAMQDKLHRALKYGGIGVSDAPASQAYNV